MDPAVTGPRPAPDAAPRGGARPPQPAGAYRPGAARPRSWKTRLRTWLLRAGIPAVVLVVMFLPYPYQTGGSFQFLPASRAELRSEVEGLVEEVLVREGQWVDKGQPIARLAQRVHEKNLKAAEAQLEEIHAQLALLHKGAKPEEIERAESAVRTAETSLAWSRSRADRYAKLSREELVSQQEYDNALRQRDLDTAKLAEAKADLQLVRSGARREQIDAMEAEARSLQALVDNYRTDVEHTTMSAPIAGRVVTPRIEELQGTYLKPGQRDLVAQIEDSRVMRAEVQVPEEDVADVRVGARVKVVPWAYHDRVFTGQVVSIAPIAATETADASSATVVGQGEAPTQMAMANTADKVVRVITEFDNKDGLLKSEMTGYAKIGTGDRPVWDVLLRPIIRWCMVEVWYWIP